MVKSVKLWKMDWFKNDDSNGGSMAQAISECLDNNVVIHSQTQKSGRLWGSVEPKQLLKLLETNHGIYEVITKFPHKVYFDIDGKVERQHTEEEFKNWVENTLAHLEEFFPDADYAISGSNTEKKISLHIVLNNYVIHNEEERQYIKHLAKYIYENYDLNYDWKVYTKNRNMKCINQSKDDGRVQTIITNDNYKSHLITCFIPDYSLPFRNLPEEVKEEIMLSKSKKVFDVGCLPKLVLTTPDDFDVTIATATEILGLIPVNKSFNHDYTHLIARYCYYNDISFEMFLSWIQKKHNLLTPEIVEKWRNHFSKLKNFPPVSKERIISILKYFYPHITKDIHFRKFSQTFNFPIENIQKIETISREHFEGVEKYKIFNVGMGGGKTAQTISALKYEPSFVWIAPNRALATNTSKRFETEGIDICNYQDISTKKKKAGQLKEENHLIVCLNSLHYIKDVNYDVLIIDEIETLLDKFLGDFLEQGKLQLKSQIWKIFLNLFRNAKKVILLDAFITTKTLNFIKNIEPTATYKVYERLNEPQTRTVHYIETPETALNEIICKLNNGQKLFIFYPYKKQSSNWFAMEGIYKAIIAATGKKGIFYNADVDDEIKTGLKDVNTSWGDKDFVITNNIITCGINYENLDFDYKYIFVASHNTPRDMIQVSYRARHLNSGIIKVCYMGKMMQSNTWLNDCEKMNCNLYRKMYNDILIEKKAPLKRSFQLFCVKAHYKQKTDEYKITEAVEKEIADLIIKQQIGISYDKLDDLDFSQAEMIESKCMSQQATMYEKYLLKKYYFRKSFAQDTPTEDLAEIWDDDFCFFFRRFGEILLNENNVFNKIAKLNNFKNLFPVDIKKVKLNEEIIEQIFKEFSFKFITQTSSKLKIIKEIYNTFFGKQVITTVYYEMSKDLKYECDSKFNDFFEFAKDNLILNSQTYLTYNQILDQEEHFEI